MEKNVKSIKNSCPRCNQSISKSTKITNVSLTLGIFIGGTPRLGKKKVDQTSISKE